MIKRHSFYFLRHGQTDYNAGKITAPGEHNPPLNSCGKAQALLIQPKVEKLPVLTICHSPLQRTKQTAELAAQKLPCPYIEIENLRECSEDIWYKMNALKEKQNHCPQVGAFLSQTVHGVNEALDQTGPVLIVAHGGIHWALCYHLRPQDHNWDLSNCGLVYFEPQGNTGWKAELLHCNH